MIMRVVGQALGAKRDNRIQTLVLRGLACLIALYGVHSLFVIDIGPKLRMQTTFNFWGFEVAAFEFVLRHAAIIALCAVIAHYSLKLLGLYRRDRRAPRVTK
jgi:hypothetical protein